jgi:hypothetical protein
MEILPQFTQSIIFTGSKKRSRSPYDLEGHCTKKRWIEPSNPIDHYGKTNIPGQATSVSVMPGT